ncbi:MAG: PIG-L family deacetylase, partial [Aeromicrobium sp.]
TNNFHETWGGSTPNQPDHMAVGRASLNAAGDAGNRWIFPEQLTDALTPWGGVRQVWAAGSPASRHAADTTATFDRGVESLRAHRAYIDGLGWENFDPAEMLEGMSRPTGSRLGVTHAAPFEVFSLTWGD